MKAATRRTWERRPGERRTELLDAAERLFAERGLAGTTVADITDAAGVSKGSFYGYFESKAELLEALNARFGGELFAVLEDALAAAPAAGTPSKLARVLDVAVAQTIHALFERRQLLELWAREPTVIDRSAGWVNRFVDVLGGAETTTALLVAHGIFGTVLQAVVRDEDVDIDELIKTAQRFARSALGVNTR